MKYRSAKLNNHVITPPEDIKKVKINAIRQKISNFAQFVVTYQKE